MLDPIAEAVVSPKCPHGDRAAYFLSRMSAHSARGRLKAYSGEFLQQVEFNNVAMKYPERLHHLPSIVSPQMS